MILVLDNYDSFTYNLVQYFREMTPDVAVYRNDAIDLAGLEKLAPQALVISPGPGRPENAGLSCEAIRRFSGRIPILGVCLGHQAIGHVFGGAITHAQRLMHGKTSDITCDNKGVFANLGERPFKAMRYHSLVISRENFPADLLITATSEDGEIMGVRHQTHPTEGIQFHPESIMTPVGKRLLRNFLKMVRP
ncbi:MAG: aminodeoxychorismate/anthranilate synthase component II [Kiritimatiellia bacterium]